MTSNRTYSVERTVEQALSELRECSGSQFDPDVVEAFTAVCRARAGDLLAPRARVAA
jgi:HD-GYP domain-containing protein (c-di-GMP phosphodiesterase class II)